MKVILLTTHNHIAACVSVHTMLKNTLLKKHNIEVVGIVSSEPYENKQKQIAKLKQIIRKSGLSFGLKLIIVGFIQLVSLKIARLVKGEKNRTYFEIDEIANKHGIAYLRTQNINSDEVKTFIENHKSDYLVSCGLLQLVKKHILDLPIEGSINFHPSLIQEHRGTFSSFWALFRRTTTSGATVHFMTEKFDDGDVIVQKKFFVHPSDTLYSVDEKSAKIGGNLIVKALVKLKRKKTKKIFIHSLAKMLSVPSREDIEIVQKHRSHIFSIQDIMRILGFKK